MFWWRLIKNRQNGQLWHRYELGTVSNQQDWWWFGQRTFLEPANSGYKIPSLQFWESRFLRGFLQFWRQNPWKFKNFAGSHFWPTPYAKLIAQTASLRCEKSFLQSANIPEKHLWNVVDLFIFDDSGYSRESDSASRIAGEIEICIVINP